MKRLSLAALGALAVMHHDEFGERRGFAAPARHAG